MNELLTAIPTLSISPHSIQLFSNVIPNSTLEYNHFIHFHSIQRTHTQKVRRFLHTGNTIYLRMSEQNIENLLKAIGKSCTF